MCAIARGTFVDSELGAFVASLIQTFFHRSNFRARRVRPELGLSCPRELYFIILHEYDEGFYAVTNSSKFEFSEYCSSMEPIDFLSLEASPFHRDEAGSGYTMVVES